MSLALKTSTYPACHGIACLSHSQCARWHAVQGSEADHNTMGTCLDGDHYPEFVAHKPPPLPPRVSPLGELAAAAGHA